VDASPLRFSFKANPKSRGVRMLQIIFDLRARWDSHSYGKLPSFVSVVQGCFDAERVGFANLVLRSA
jgi:hypothetical protein